ncbi:aldo/keto reductase [Streptomyces sp. NPDC096311]|uniref:aldo/keto reductase n=1 Tax=Streptomyces sp. NPDC096311 TaxID=3366083 RepID=UPI00382656D6
MFSPHAGAEASGTFVLGGDLAVHRLGYGAMRLTGPGIWGPPADPDGARAVLRRAVELGVNFIDTADSYGPNLNEELIAEALYPYPAQLVIGTKAGFLRTGPSQWHHFARPDYLRQQAETSLRRLKTDVIDLWQLHRIDPDVPEEAQFATLKALQEEGKIRHLGLSEVDVPTLERALAFGLDIATVQNRYNLVVRDSEPVLDRCTELGIVFIPWFPIAQGILAEPGTKFSDTARELEVTTAQLSLAWLLHRSPVILPIPGTSSLEHLEENLAAGSIRLTDEQFTELDELGKTLAPEFDVPAGA